MLFSADVRRDGARGMIRIKRLARPAEVDAVVGIAGVSKRGRSDVDVLVGRRLREARLLAGLSRGQVGVRIGVTFRAVQKYESGENRLSASRLLALAALLRLLRYCRRIGTEAGRDWMLKLAKHMGGGSVPGQATGKPI